MNTMARSTRRFSLFSLFRRAVPAPLPGGEDTLLSPKAAAFLLQPHMPNRHALAWLAMDRNVDPALPCVLKNGEVFYRLSDVREFIQRMPRIDTSTVREFRERRGERDQRASGPRQLLVERRKLIDRRSGFDRRSGLDRRNLRDDFGYGRRGERRALGSA